MDSYVTLVWSKCCDWLVLCTATKWILVIKSILTQSCIWLDMPPVLGVWVPHPLCRAANSHKSVVTLRLSDSRAHERNQVVRWICVFKLLLFSLCVCVRTAFPSINCILTFTSTRQLVQAEFLVTFWRIGSNQLAAVVSDISNLCVIDSMAPPASKTHHYLCPKNKKSNCCNDFHLVALTLLQQRALRGWYWNTLRALFQAAWIPSIFILSQQLHWRWHIPYTPHHATLRGQ